MVFHHSEKVSQNYKGVAKILQQVLESGCGLKASIYKKNNKSNRNNQRNLALASNILKKKKFIEHILKETNLLNKEPRLNRWLTYVLVHELIWRKDLDGQAIPYKIVNSYKQELKNALETYKEDKCVRSETEGSILFSAKMDNQEGPLIPEHTKRASTAALGLLFYSFLMFTLPFATFFGTRSLLRNYFECDEFTTTGFSVLAVVLTVNAIIVAYAYKAYHEPEYDEQGNRLVFDSSLKDDLNKKQN